MKPSDRRECDGCGQTDGAVKRTCPYKVLGDSLRDGTRTELPYCHPPILCDNCYAALGGDVGVHGERCRRAAEESQAAADGIEAAMDAGESFSTDAWGDWEESVPKGMVGLRFLGRAGETFRLIRWADYPNRRMTLSEAAGSRPWNRGRAVPSVRPKRSPARPVY